MWRKAAVVAAACLLAAACTPRAGVTVLTTDPSGGESTQPASGESAAAPLADQPPDRFVELPGLLDPSDEPIPDDPGVRTGTLANGLRYYVRHNDNPGAKAELRLAIDAGSVDEFGPSTGTAHFVEHMLFNGTERFPENELIQVLRGFGAAFGADVNAYTSFDETVYSLTVPSAPESLETGLTVLEQWLSHATFDPDQVVAERGVVLDEWRIRTQTTSGRLFDVAADLFVADTAYADRTPIGTEDSIAAMEAPELRAYYDAWYRPDNAAVVVVGEIDVDAVEAAIERLFGPAEARANLELRRDTAIPVETEPDFGLHADPDQLTVDVEVTLPLPSFESDGTAEARAELIDAMIHDALLRRLDHDLAAGRAPFDQIVRSGNSFVEPLDAPALSAHTDDDRVTATLQVVLDEYERANRFGFGGGETDTARQNIRSFFQSRFDGRDSTQDREYADTYVDDFLSGGGYPSIDDEYDVATRIIDSITPDDLDLRFRARWSNSAPHVIISTPEVSVDRMPTGDEVMELIAELDDRPLEPRAEANVLPADLMERPVGFRPAEREIVDFDDPLFDPIEITYPNGARVILNSNQIVEGQVFFAATSPGGSSLVADDDVIDALYAAEIVTSSGVADFNRAELAEILAGRDVELRAEITPYLDRLEGSAATGDLEMLFQLIHLYMVQPRFDPVALGQLERRVGPLIADPASDPSAVASDAFAEARYPGELRYAVIPEADEFATLDLDGVERVWTSRFGNAADWVFVLSGDLDLDTAADLASAYLGALPATEPETWIDVEDPPPNGVVTVEERAGTGDTASLTLRFTTPVETVDERLRALTDVATEVISARLTDVIREDLGESYSPGAASAIVTDPDPVIETSVVVTGAPDRIGEFAQLVVGELAALGSAGPTQAEFERAFAQVEVSYNFVNNLDFIEELTNDTIHPALDLDDYLLQYPALLADVDADSVRDHVRERIPADRYIQVTVLPR